MNATVRRCLTSILAIGAVAAMGACSTATPVDANPAATSSSSAAATASPSPSISGKMLTGK